MASAASESLFRQFFDEMELLLEATPRLHALTRPGESIETLPGWTEWQQKPRLIVETGQPVLVAALAGPTGAGKSTLFSLLTGIEVPRSLKRPTSYACALAAPPDMTEGEGLGRFFPGHRLRPLDKPDRLTEPGLPEEDLFFAPGSMSRPDGPRVIFADLPDFNAVDESNWQKAERMLARAEVVIFMTYAEGYKDEVVVRHLRRVCEIAGCLVFLFNKTPGDGKGAVPVAKQLWEDLLAYAAEDPLFNARRSDGRPLHAFLEEAPVFAAPRSEELRLDEIEPIYAERADFISTVAGIEAERVLLSNLMEISTQGIRSCRQLAVEAEKEAGRLDKDIATVTESIRETTGDVAGSHFPIGRLVSNLVAEARASKSVRFRRYLAMPSAIASRVAGAAVGNLKRFLRKDTDELKSWEEIERKHLDETTEKLIDRWRNLFREKEDANLTSSRCREATEAFHETPLPPPPADWDKFVRSEGRKWVEKHPWRAAALATLGDLMLLGGMAAVAIDFAVAGGMGTMGVIAAAGAGSAAAGLVVDAFGKLQLGKVLELADREWRKQRAQSLSVHLETRLAGPLFLDRWKKRRDELRQQPLAEIRQVCDRLETLKPGR